MLIRNAQKYGAAGAVAAITSLTIVGAAPLLDATNDFGDATARVGINGDGYVCKAVMPFLTGAVLDPSKLTFNVTDPRPAGGTITRIIKGGKILRRQYTPGGGQNNNQESNTGVGGVETVWFFLTADSAEFATIYAGTTINSVTAAVGFYGIAASGAVTTKTNSSTRTYYKPGAAWLNRQHEVCGTGGQYVELVAMHKHGRAGQQVEKVDFIATDASTHTAATQTASIPIISTLCTKGQPPEVYAATIPVTALAQSDLCIVNAKVYPWIGDASSILDLAVDGFNAAGTVTTTHPHTPLRFLNDKGGTYGAAHVSVKAGAVGGTAQSTEVASRATPYPDIRTALFAIATFNNGRSNHTGIDGSHVWLMDNGSGGAVVHDLAGLDMASGLTVNQNALTEIRKSPSNTANASVIVQTSGTFIPWGLSWHVDIACTSANMTGSGIQYYCDGTYTQSGSGIIHFQQLAGVRNLTHVGATADTIELASSGTDSMGWVGYDFTSAVGGSNARVRSIIGCKLRQTFITEYDPTVLTGRDTQDGKIIVNNQFLHSSGAHRVGDTFAVTRGLFIGQNVFEAAGGGVQQLLSICDLGSDQAYDNCVVTGNTMVGNRLNLMYTNISTKLKRAWTRFNLLDARNTKADLYTTDSTATGRNGSFAYINGVDNWDVCLSGDSNSGNTTIGVGQWLGEYWANPAMCAVGRTNVHFTTDNSEQGANTGLGVYSLTGTTNAAYNTVPAGMSAFKYDIAGVLRKTDGTGAAGAYERTV